MILAMATGTVPPEDRSSYDGYEVAYRAGKQSASAS
jgi:molybdopterin biosynthesis enzyme